MRVLRRRGVYWETYRGSSYTRGRVTKYEDKKVVIDPRRRGSLVEGQCLGNLGGKEMTLTALLRCGGVDPKHHKFYG